jgi:hypothetical protein
MLGNKLVPYLELAWDQMKGVLSVQVWVLRLA